MGKFLNRLLGTSLTKQRLLTDCLLQFHGIEVANAKTGGKYDVGITTLAGQSVEFVDKPRSFCFGGVASIQVYQVQVDQGLSFEIALEMYNNEQGAKQVGKIKTGFYVQKRLRLDKTSKVFLIINPGRNSKCVVVRPNVGRRVMSKLYVTSRIRHGEYTPIDETEAKGLWGGEFERADRPSSEDYQYGCKGRHNTRHIFAGSLIPVLNTMISDVSEFEEDKQLFRVVRVETSKKLDQADLLMPSKKLGIDIDAVDEPKEATSDIDIVVIGQGAAYEMKSLGSIVLRGNVVSRHQGDHKWVVEFSNGRKFKMNADQVKSARHHYEKEVNNLVNVNMARADASSLSETAVGATLKKAHQPILAEGHEETEKYETIFEEHYQGTVPDTIVGIEFAEVEVMEDDLMLWESVLRNLAKKLLSEGVGSASQLENMDGMSTKKGNSLPCGVIELW